MCCGVTCKVTRATSNEVARWVTKAARYFVTCRHASKMHADPHGHVNDMTPHDPYLQQLGSIKPYLHSTLLDVLRT